MAVNFPTAMKRIRNSMTPTIEPSSPSTHSALYGCCGFGGVDDIGTELAGVSDGGGAAAISAAPQAEQNLLVFSLGTPHLLQYIIDSFSFVLHSE